MKNLIKRVQSRACSNFAERENFGPLAKQKVFFILALLLMAATAHAEEVTGVTYLYYADQAAAIAGTPSTGTANCTKVEASDSEVTWNSGWYVVNEDVTISARIDVVGEVNLILADGATLTSTVCINTNGATLNIYGQALGTGTLKATGSNGNAGIGGTGTKDAGTLTINGGNIIAKGGVYQTRSGGVIGSYVLMISYIEAQRYDYLTDFNQLNCTNQSNFQQIIDIHQQKTNKVALKHNQSTTRHKRCAVLCCHILSRVISRLPGRGNVEAQAHALILLAQVANSLQRAITTHGSCHLEHLQQVLALEGETQSL